MRLKNYTNIPDEKIREIIKFVSPPRATRVRFVIRNRNNHGVSGHAYGETGEITISFGKIETGYPYWLTRRPNSGYLEMLIRTKEEALVMVIAHELRHIWQARRPRGGRIWGASKKGYSERDADAYAIKMLRAWRRAKAEPVDISSYLDIFTLDAWPEDVIMKTLTISPEELAKMVPIPMAVASK